MASANLRDFRPDHTDLNSENEQLEDGVNGISTSTYHEEINTLKIDKLSNRVTIISIIIPCLIGAILVFAYLDIKERVVDVDQTKQSQVDKISQQLEEKLNALDVRIAKNRYDLDNQLPELSRKDISIEGQIAKLTTTKADNTAITTQFSKLEKRISKNTDQDKTTIQTIERIKKETFESIQKNQNHYDTSARQIKDEIALFKEEFDARLLELSEYEHQIGELRKNLSLLDKKIKKVEQDNLTQISLDRQINILRKELALKLSTLDQKVTTNISRMQRDLDHLLKTSSNKPKPSPQINIDSTGSVNIEEELLAD